MADFVCGANEEGFHLSGVNWGRDAGEPGGRGHSQRRRRRSVSPDGKGTLKILRGIEVGHIFQLRTKYSEALKATYLDDKQQPQPMEMGCYGIGITRIAAAAIEQDHDERGIVFPRPIAPFEACLVPIGFHKSAAVREAAEKLYAELVAAGIDVLLEDRDERPGVLFADMDLLGIPHRLVISERGLAAGTIEYKGRTQAAAENAPLASALQFLKDKFAARMRSALALCPAAVLLAAHCRRSAATRPRKRLPTACAPRCRPRSRTARSRCSISGAARRTRYHWLCGDVQAPGAAHPGPQAAHRASEDRAVRGDAQPASTRNWCWA